MYVGAKHARGHAPLGYVVAGHLVVWSLVGASSVYAVRFGTTLVEWAPWLGAGLSAVLEIMKALWLTFVIAAWRGRQRIRALAGIGLLACVVTYSWVAVQHMASRDLGAHDAEAASVEAKRGLLARAIEDAERRRDASGETASAAALEAEIAGLLARPGVDGCATINGRVTREVCPQVATLRARAATAKGRDAARGEVERLRWELGNLPVIKRGDRTTGQALPLLIATILEATTLLGLWVVGSAPAAAAASPACLGVDPGAAETGAGGAVAGAGSRANALGTWLRERCAGGEEIAFRQREAATELRTTPAVVSRTLRTLAGSGALTIIATGRGGTVVRLAPAA